MLHAFNSLWELDGVRTLVLANHRYNQLPNFQFPVGIRWCSDHCSLFGFGQAHIVYFNSPWELDGVRTSVSGPVGPVNPGSSSFNSLWELDGVRTVEQAPAGGLNPGLSIPCGN